jgi:Fic family protein
LPIILYNNIGGEDMNYKTVKELSLEWNISERSIRDYCNKGRIPGAVLNGKTWLIPEDAVKPNRQIRHTNTKKELLDILKLEKDTKRSGGIYHELQIEMTYNSNHIEGSQLTYDETRYIFETKTINSNNTIKVNDIIETINHFRCIDLVIDMANYKLTESMINQFHFVLKNNSIDSLDPTFMVGNYKLKENVVGGIDTTSPDKVSMEMKRLLDNYNCKKEVTIADIIEFHHDFETIHPFQDGNGRVGRLIMLKECLKYNYVPIFITDDIKMFYYRGLKNWNEERGWLIDTCLSGQDRVKELLSLFKIDFE